MTLESNARDEKSNKENTFQRPAPKEAFSLKRGFATFFPTRTPSSEKTNEQDSPSEASISKKKKVISDPKLSSLARRKNVPLQNLLPLKISIHAKNVDLTLHELPISPEKDKIKLYKRLAEMDDKLLELQHNPSYKKSEKDIIDILVTREKTFPFKIIAYAKDVDFYTEELESTQEEDRRIELYGQLTNIHCKLLELQRDPLCANPTKNVDDILAIREKIETFQEEYDKNSGKNNESNSP